MPGAQVVRKEVVDNDEAGGAYVLDIDPPSTSGSVDARRLQKDVATDLAGNASFNGVISAATNSP